MRSAPMCVVPSALLVAATIAAAATLGGCASGRPQATGGVDGKARGQMHCPISGEPVSESSPHALVGVNPVYCSSVADARQFAALSAEKRERLYRAQRAEAEGSTAAP